MPEQHNGDPRDEDLAELMRRTHVDGTEEATAAIRRRKNRLRVARNVGLPGMGAIAVGVALAATLASEPDPVQATVTWTNDDVVVQQEKTSAITEGEAQGLVIGEGVDPFGEDYEVSVIVPGDRPGADRPQPNPTACLVFGGGPKIGYCDIDRPNPDFLGRLVSRVLPSGATVVTGIASPDTESVELGYPTPSGVETVSADVFELSGEVELNAGGSAPLGPLGIFVIFVPIDYVSPLGTSTQLIARSSEGEALETNTAWWIRTKASSDIVSLPCLPGPGVQRSGSCEDQSRRLVRTEYAEPLNARVAEALDENSVEFTPADDSDRHLAWPGPAGTSDDRGLDPLAFFLQTPDFLERIRLGRISTPDEADRLAYVVECGKQRGAPYPSINGKKPTPLESSLLGGCKDGPSAEIFDAETEQRTASFPLD